MTSRCCFKLTHCLLRGLRDNLFHLGRSTLSGAIESFDFGPSVEVEGKKYTASIRSVLREPVILPAAVRFKRQDKAELADAAAGS